MISHKTTMPPIADTAAAKWAYSSLVFSIFYLFNVVVNFKHYTTPDLIMIAAVYLSFIVCFIGATRTNDNRAVGFILGIIAVAGLGTAITPGTNALFGYAAFLAGYYFSLKLSVSILLLNLAVQLTAAYLMNYWHPMFLGPSIAVSLGLQVYGVFSQKEYFYKQEQAQKNQQIEQLAAIAERERIARDMHDLLGHSLSSLALKSELSQKLIDKQQYEAAGKEVQDVAQIARECLTQVRLAVSGLNQTGLKATINKLTEQLESMKIEVFTDVSYQALPAKVESALIMILKESVTNIMRHSKATKVSIALSQTNEHWYLHVSDNGQHGVIQQGNGLRGMAKRAEELGGQFKLQQSTEKQSGGDKGSGLAIHITIPIEKTINDKDA